MVVKKISAVILLIFYLLSATTIAELLKIPLLVTHYYAHQDANKNITLKEFLTIHYYSADVMDMDALEDSQLPFKSVENASTVTFVALTPPPSIEIVAEFTTKISSAFGIRNELFLPFRYIAAIWQPPRSY